jgi:predicted MPP superfamily phosphohydrolase
MKFLDRNFLDFILPNGKRKSFDSLAQSNWFTVATVRLKLKRLPYAFSGLRVVQISDIHMGGWINRERLQQVADWIAAQRPDVLVITGDFLIGSGFTEVSEQWIHDLKEVLSPLGKSIPSFAVLGNHDYWTNPEAIREMLALSGIVDLTNNVFTLTRDGQNLHFCGVDDIREGNVRLDLVVHQLTSESAAILLAHEPDFADVSAATEKFDLQISGHTHGGQVVLPFIGAPILPHLGRKYPSGLYEVRDMFQYTNRGLGANRFAIRWNCPPEVTIFVLESMGSEVLTLSNGWKSLVDSST